MQGTRTLPTAPTQSNGNLIDVGAVQRRLDARLSTPYRLKEATFHAPADATPGQFKQIYAYALAQWFKHLEKEWLPTEDQRKFKLHDRGNVMESGLIVPGMKRWVVRGEFKYVGGAPTHERIEIDPSWTKEHGIPMDRTNEQSVKNRLEQGDY